eukprot:3212587-Amphidinium_carterae.1
MLSDRRDNEGSLEFMMNMVNGAWAWGANFILGVVDVRDVALAHRTTHPHTPPGKRTIKCC